MMTSPVAVAAFLSWLIRFFVAICSAGSLPACHRSGVVEHEGDAQARVAPARGRVGLRVERPDVEHVHDERPIDGRCLDQHAMPVRPTIGMKASAKVTAVLPPAALRNRDHVLRRVLPSRATSGSSS